MQWCISFWQLIWICAIVKFHPAASQNEAAVYTPIRYGAPLREQNVLISRTSVKPEQIPIDDTGNPSRPTSEDLHNNKDDSGVANTTLSLCRVKDKYLPPELFQLETCALCYFYVPDQPLFFEPGSKWKLALRQISTADGNFSVTFLEKNNQLEAANCTDPNSTVLQSLRTQSAADKWSLCCKQAAQCCEQMLQAEPVAGDRPFCPRTWDGWQCWPDTEPEQVSYALCPNYIYFGTDPPACPRYATKECTSSGMWYRRGGLEKTDYTPCGAVVLLQQRTVVHLASYAISIAALLPALLIFFIYKQLNVYRIRLHRNLFVSILLNAVMVITFQSVVIMKELNVVNYKDSYIKQNAMGCKILFMLTKYFRMTNYMWMFCEGYYLHRLLSAAFAEQKSFSIFYVLGWGFPVLPTGIYTVLRALYQDENCWVLPIEAYEWVLNTPCLVSLVVNMIFLINIIRILVIKLRNAPTNEPSQYRKAVRATLVLVPLFGLHFIVTIYRPPDKGCEWIEVYYYVNYLLDGLQGCLVAIIFCYANGEVHYLLKRTYKRFKEERRSSTRFPNGTRGSVFLGRSTGSTNFTMMDSPNPQKHLRIPLAVVPPLPTINSEHNSQEETIGMHTNGYSKPNTDYKNRTETDPDGTL